MTELIDVLTPDGKPAGIRKPKADIHRDGDWHRAAHIWVIHPDGRILVQRRSPRKENNPDLWDVSAAGHLSAGESSVDAAVRETFEEIGLRLDRGELKLAMTLRASCVLNNDTYYDNEFHDIFVVVRDVDIASLRLDPEEVAEVQWIDQLRPDASWVPHAEEYAWLSRWLRSDARRRA